MTVAVIIAARADVTAQDGPDEPGPAAALRWGDDPDAPSLLTRLCGQLAELNVPDPQIITRPEFAPVLRKDGHEPVECADPAADLAEIARLARRDGDDGPVLLLPGDLAVSTELLTRLVSDARGPATAVTVAGNGRGTAPVRTRRGRIVSAGSPSHQVTEPDAASPGALRVGRTRAGELADIAEKLSILLDVPGAMPALEGVRRDPEAAELLLVGLVRSGVPVAECTDPDLVCLRADGAHTARAAHEAVTAVNEDRVRLKAAVKNEDGFFATYAVSSYSPYLVRLAARRGLTPNTVTCLSMGLAALAAVWFAEGTRAGMVTGAALFYLSFVLDCVDGQLARYTRRFSALGAWLDAIFDRAKEYTVFAGLAIGSTAAAIGDPVHGGDVWPLAAAALVLQTVRHMVDFSFKARTVPPAAAPEVIPLTVPGDGAKPGAAHRVSPETATGVARLSATTSRIRVLHWAKKMVVLPIGERFALIGLTAAVGNARWTFAVLLLWGSVAAAYTLTGRVLRTISR